MTLVTRLVGAIFLSVVVFSFAFPATASASSFIAQTDSGELFVEVFETHVEITDASGNRTVLTSDENGFVTLEKFQISGLHSVESHDLNGVTVTSEEQDAYDELMNSIHVSATGDDSGGGGISPNPIFRPGSFDEPKGESTRSWDCASAVLGLAAAGVGVLAGCGGPQAGLACGAALLAYLSASANYYGSCT